MLIYKDKLIAMDMKYYFFLKQMNIGDTLPSERSLSQKYHASRSTIHQALILLESEGIIQKRNRKYCLTYSKFDVNTSIILNQKNDPRIKSNILHKKEIEANKNISNLFEIPLGNRVLEITFFDKYESEAFPFKLSTLRISIDFLNTFNIKKIKLNMLSSIFKEKIVSELQNIKLTHASPAAKDILHLPSKNTIVVRNSLFLSKSKKKVISLEEETIPSHCLISGADSSIFRKMHNFLE
ncbi:Bacterial regulatory protein, gntR family [Lactobacillus crispatus]|uniref:GntR family transcriptional regulator n=1 Tax=Lactobacillus crispatus TaxID=47770 RepID=UPI0018E3C70D|nr:GntR family transcriptional regulator [Lactobacillus crispatus]MBI1720773.1 Bacterial regulatory protein, gntR family [Lactobacillus crispatus]